MRTPVHFQAMPDLEKSRWLCIGCIIHQIHKNTQVILSLHQASSEEAGKQCLPLLQQNSEFSCQHLHTSAIRTNVVTLEIIITIIKTQ